MTGRLAIAICSLALWATSGFAQIAVEQRCLDIDALPGHECVCSEPLNFSATVDSASFDPPDSPDATECSPSQGPTGESLAVNAFGLVDTVTGSSVGLSNASRVLRVGHPIQTAKLLHGETGCADCTICIRNYWTKSNATANQPDAGRNFKVSADSEAPKTISDPTVGIAYTWGKGAHLAGTEGGSPYTWANASNIGKNDKGSDFVSVGWNDCVAPTWCYDERCYDHNKDGSDKVQMRHRFGQIGNPNTHSAQNYKRQSSETSNASMSTGGREMGIRFGCFGSDTSHCPNYRYWSQHMVAKKDSVDENFWIGPSIELEGAPSPPAAPFGTVTVTARSPGTSPATIDLDGSGVTCVECQSYAWTRTGGTGGGCDTGDIDNAAAQTTFVAGCTEGTHTFNLRATNATDFHDAADTETVAPSVPGGVGLGVRLLSGVGASGVGGVGGP